MRKRGLPAPATAPASMAAGAFVLLIIILEHLVKLSVVESGRCTWVSSSALIYIQKRVHSLAFGVIGRNVKLVNSFIQVDYTIFGNIDVIKWVFRSYLEKFGVFFQAKHLVEKLKGFIIGLCLFNTCKFHLFALKFGLIWQLCPLCLQKSALFPLFSHLLFRHQRSSLSLQLLSTFFYNFDQFYIRICNGDSTHQNNVN